MLRGRIHPHNDGRWKVRKFYQQKILPWWRDQMARHWTQSFSMIHHQIIEKEAGTRHCYLKLRIGEFTCDPNCIVNTIGTYDVILGIPRLKQNIRHIQRNENNMKIWQTGRGGKIGGYREKGPWSIVTSWSHHMFLERKVQRGAMGDHMFLQLP